jgi:hypothetical protein
MTWVIKCKMLTKALLVSDKKEGRLERRPVSQTKNQNPTYFDKAACAAASLAIGTL